MSCVGARANVFERVGSGCAMPCVGTREHVAVQKMLRRDHPCAFYTFVWLIFLTLPCAFI